MLSNLTYVLSVTNLGPSVATSVIVNNSLPESINVLSTSASQGAVVLAANNLNWNIGTLTVGAKASLTIVAATTTNGNLTATATVSGTQADPNPANNSAASVTLVAPPFVSVASAGATLTYESGPVNGAVDLGETVTAILRLRDDGNVSTRNLVASLLATNGVLPVPPNSPQTYGILSPSGFPVGRPFSFTASSTNGSAVSAVLQLQDGTNTYPPVTFTFALPNTFVSASTNAFIIPDPATPHPQDPCNLAPPSRIPRPSAYPTW